MRRTRAEVLEGYPVELERFEALLRSLSDADWQTATRCEGWVVADVAALEHQPAAGGRVDRGLQPLALLLDDPGDAHHRAVGQEAVGDRLAEGTAAAGHEGDAGH